MPGFPAGSRTDTGMPLGTSIYWYITLSEQFYLFYPLVLLLLLRAFSQRTCAILFAGLRVAALLWRYVRIFHFGAWEGGSWLCTDAYFDVILLGGVLALWHRAAPGQAQEALAPMIRSRECAIWNRNAAPEPWRRRPPAPR